MSADKSGKLRMRGFLRRWVGAGLAVGTAGGLAAAPASADPVVTCGGFAMLGGAQLNCSHTAPNLPAQLCTYSWALMTTANASKIVEGSFLLAPGITNAMVYQGSGFNYALSNPIVICQGRRSR